MNTYAQFIQAKERKHNSSGITAQTVNPSLFEFQKPPVRWHLKKGKSCLFAGTGLGKTVMQGAFLEQLEGRRLIVAPLGVTGQTVEECARILNVEVVPVRKREDVGKSGIYILNYDRIEMIEGLDFEGVVPDESSILKSHDGAYRKYLTERFAYTPFKLPCTATPAPNDYMELATHAEFVGAMRRQEMLATFFTHDGGDTSQWRLKRHAVKDFWQWVASWACTFNMPSDLGFSDEGYVLPELLFHEHTVHVESDVAGGLFSDGRVSATGTFKVLRNSAEDRAAVVRDLVAKEPEESWLIWVNTDHEQDLLEKCVEAVSVRGSDKREVKEDRLLGFAHGKYQSLISKSKIAGFGMNFQRCSHVVFCGVTYSFEQMYQAIRRCWRFGQKKPVHVHLVTCNAQESIKAALRVKGEAFTSMAEEMRRYVKQEVMP